MPDHVLREQLSSAMWGVLYRRPAWPAFSGDVYAMPEASNWHRASPIETADNDAPGETSSSSASHIPEWILRLRTLFNAHSRTDDHAEGPILEVMTWFLHGHHHEVCIRPRQVRIDATQFMWRSTIVVAWLDHLQRAQPLDFHVANPPFSSRQGQRNLVQIIISQQLSDDQRAVLVDSGSQSPDGEGVQRAAIIPRQVSAMDVRSVLPRILRGPELFTVSQNDYTFAEDQLFLVANGDSFVLRALPSVQEDSPIDSALQAPEDESDDHFLLQLHSALSTPSAVIGTPVNVVGGSFPAVHGTAPVVAGNKQSKVLLSLDACIAQPCPYKVDGHFGAEITYCSRSDWPNWLASTAVELVSLPDGLDLTAQSLYALSCPESHCEPELAGNLVLYVDGSARQGSAAWSVVAVWYNQQGLPALRGCLSGIVHVQPDSDQWLGADGADNISAELSAAVAAMVVALCGEHYDPVVVRPDLRLSAMLANLEWQCHVHVLLGRLCQVLGTWFHKIHGRFIEVRGHSQHPWNDLADALAKWTVDTQIALGHIGWFPFHELIRSGDLSWAWLFDASSSLHQCLPTGSFEGCWQVTPSLRHVTPPSPPAQIDKWTCVQFNIVSANVLALGEEFHDIPTSPPSDRALRLDKYWHEQQIVAIGIQESRRPAGKVFSDHYFGFASGHQQCGRAKHFGCELWLHRTLPLDCQGKLIFSDFKAVVVVADPRRLVVNLHHPSMDLSFVVLHVPCKSSSCSLSQLEDWWTETIQILQGAKLATRVWCMVDANAPLASESTPYFDMHGAESSNQQGRLFEHAISTLGWFVPSTMPWAHEGPHGTWTHPRGITLRRDFILCSAEAFKWTASTWVDCRFDGGFSHDDHFPVGMSNHGWMRNADTDGKVVWDRLAFVDPIKQKQFKEAVASLPIPDWSTHVDSHAELLQNNLFQLAKQHFQKTRRDRSRPRLTEPTYNLIAFKRSCLDYGRNNGLMQDPEFKLQLRSLEKDIRRQVQKDQRAFYSELVQELSSAGELHDARQVYRLLTKLGGRRVKTGSADALPLLRHNGKPIHSFVEQQRLWMKQFAEVEAANIMARSEFQRLLPACLGLDASIVDFEVFPDLHEVLQQIHRMKRGKAPGPDGIPPDVLKAGSHEIAKHLVILTTKIAAHGREPEAWRTGRLIPLHKGKSARSDPSGYRSIFLNNFAAKIYHSVLRKHLVQAWVSVMHNLQLGGRKGLGCDSAHHLVQAHLAFCRVRKQPGAILFVDCKSAFYTVVRQGLFAQEIDSTAFVAAMHRLGIHPQKVDDLLKHASAEVAIRNISPHAIALLRDVLQTTCFQLDGIPEVAATTRGTRPGDPIGDVAFNIMMAVLLADVTEHISTSQAKWEGSPDPVQDFCSYDQPNNHAWAEVAYVDDLAVLLRSPDNDALLGLAKQASVAVVDAAQRRGLQLTIGDGKTELLWALHGIGKKRIVGEAASCNNCIEVPLPDGSGPLHVPVVLSYRHLGTWVQNDSKPLRAIRARVAAAKQAWAPLVKPFLSKRGVLLRTKLQVFESLVLSRFLFNAHTWCMLQPAQLDEWAAGLRPMLFALAKPQLRGLAPFSFDMNILCGACEILPPYDLLHVARLRYFKRLLSFCPVLLWNLLKAVESSAGSWLSLLKQSLAWLCRFSSPHFGFTSDTPINDWCSFVAVDTRWKGRLKRAISSCRRYWHEQAKDAIWHSWLQQSLLRQGVEVGCRRDSSPSEQWMCMLCDQVFHSKRALAMHSSKRHGYKTLVKHFAFDGTCPNCSRVFHDRVRLCCHLRTADACLERVRAAFPPLSLSLMEELEIADRAHAKEMRVQGWLASKAKMPALRCEGPWLPPPGSVEADYMLSRWKTRQGIDAVPAFEALEGVCLQHNEGHEPADLEPVGLQKQDEQMAFVMHSDQGSDLGHNGQFSLRGLATLYAKLHIRTMCFIHMFSGFRRQGDLQHCVERHWVQGIHHIFCISVDFCLQGQDGDLSSTRSREFWKKQIYSGAILGMGGGPPCETFSAARFLADGPPPLRSYEEMCGLPSNNRRQWDQTALGSSLLRFMVEMLFHCALVGACGFLEHPAFPTWARVHRPASTWALQAVRWLKRLQCVAVVTFDQCIFQCEGRKPTSLLLLRLPTLRDVILKKGRGGRCPHAPGTHVSLQGCNPDGSFRTSIAKIYPEPLNDAIAGAIINFASATFDHSFEAEPVSSVVAGFSCLDFVPREVVQPDYHGG